MGVSTPQATSSTSTKQDKRVGLLTRGRFFRDRGTVLLSCFIMIKHDKRTVPLSRKNRPRVSKPTLLSCLVEVELVACGVDTPKVHKTSSDDADDQVYGHGVREVFGRIKVVVRKKHSK